jgi:serine/threonine-protein kinase
LRQTLNGKPWPAEQAVKMVETLARAMQAAHDRGIVHRDLKPGNILIASDGTPKITDFGLAKRLEAPEWQTQSGELIGTPTYMSPEQALGRSGAIGRATDIYMLGAILYELLTGKPPFRGETAIETIRQVVESEPIPPSRIQTVIPRDVEIICLKCLQKDPKARYPSAGALADDLARWLASEPISAKPVGLLEKLRRRLFRSRP